MCRSEVTHEPMDRYLLVDQQLGDTAKAIWPPSPTNAQRPQVRVFSSADACRLALPEASMLA